MEKSETYFGIMTLIFSEIFSVLSEGIWVPQHSILRATKEHIWMGFIRVLKMDPSPFLKDYISQ